MGSGRGWLAGDWSLTGGVLNITAVAWTAAIKLLKLPIHYNETETAFAV